MAERLPVSGTPSADGKSQYSTIAAGDLIWISLIEAMLVGSSS
jgi:hypothetical protein